MIIPKDNNKDTLREYYNKAQNLAYQIEARAPKNFHEFFTSYGWLNMVTEEQLPHQVGVDIAVAFVFAAVVVFISTLNILYTNLMVWSMVSSIFLTIGILYFTGWAIGTNEAIMISIASRFCADFIIQPMLAMSLDASGRSLFGKMQAALIAFATPVSSALITTLVAAAFLYPCIILLSPPFATFLLFSGIFGILHGFIVLPAQITLLQTLIDKIVAMIKMTPPPESI
jgi:hypothetical protein